MKRDRFLKVLCLAITLSSQGPSGLAQTTLQSQVITLEQAVALATDNRSLRNAELEVEKQDTRIAAIRTKRFPAFSLQVMGVQQLSKIDFLFRRGSFGDFSQIGPVPATDTFFSTPLRPTVISIGQISQPISQLHSVGLNLRQAGIGKQIAQEQLRAGRQNVSNDIKRAYYGILRTQSATRAAEQALALYKELDRLTEGYVLQQVSLKSDSLDVKARLAKSEYDLLTYGDMLATQKAQLNHLLARDVRTEFDVQAIPEATEFESDLESARRLALNQRSEIKQAKLKVELSEYDKRIKKSEFIPELSATVNYLSLRNFSDFLPKNVLSAGVSLSWEVFDWGRKDHELAEKDRTIKQAQNNVSDAESLVLLDVDNRFRQVRQARQLLRVAQMNQETRKETLRVVTNKYSLQAALLKEVLQEQASIEQANYEYQQALMGFWTAKADFEKSLGEDH